MSQITKIAWELNEKTPNRYQLVYELIELAKKLVDESQMKKNKDDFGYDFDATLMQLAAILLFVRKTGCNPNLLSECHGYQGFLDPRKSIFITRRLSIL